MEVSVVGLGQEREKREERKESRQKLREGKGICKGYEREKLLQ